MRASEDVSSARSSLGDPRQHPVSVLACRGRVDEWLAAHGGLPLAARCRRPAVTECRCAVSLAESPRSHRVRASGVTFPAGAGRTVAGVAGQTPSGATSCRHATQPRLHRAPARACGWMARAGRQRSAQMNDRHTFPGGQNPAYRPAPLLLFRASGHAFSWHCPAWCKPFRLSTLAAFPGKKVVMTHGKKAASPVVFVPRSVAAPPQAA